ncbi:kelch-like protein 25 [Arctopsyche grandis]|uniref:kelch-like protein 25 n=1 Tax=Arctopsyche grandis TaxID=121162 RepID=UPI00406D9223
MFVSKPKSDFAANRLEYLYDATKKHKHCDVIFFVRNRSYYVHLVVLSACSEFFVRNEDKLSETFSDFDFTVIDAIMKYCYTGEISIDDHHYQKFLELASLLELKVPPQYKTVDLSNCIEVLKLTNDSELKKKAMDLTLENFETLHKTQDFLNLPVSTVMEILNSDDLIVPSEEDVFNSVKSWINYDDASRKNDLAQLMNSVRLSLLSMEFLVKEVMKFCNSCAECVTSLRQAILDKILSNGKSLIQRETPRRKKGKIALVGGDTLDVADTIDIYDGEKKSWSLLKGIGIIKSRSASVIVGDWLVIIGGLNSSGEILTSVEYIDLKNGQKHSLKPLNQARSYFSAVTLHRDSSTDVYAIGGCGCENSIERWNSKTRDWEIMAPLLVAVYVHSASVIDDKIYVTGGRKWLMDESGKYMTINKVQMYSVESNSWTYRAQMIEEREYHSSVVFKRKLFVAGGHNNHMGYYLDSVECYDSDANLWTSFTKLPKPAIETSLCCFRNKILCMGGHDENTYLSDVWEYDDTTKTWNALNSLSIERRYSNAHIIPYDSII